MEILQDKDTFLLLTTDPTVEFQASLKKLLDEGVYMGVSLPKTHKDTFPPPLRPIVAVVGSMNGGVG